jgi:Sec-independent protein translocase protein TatA
LTGAAAGFRNEGQFVAALHVAHNLNIPFDQLKAKITGSDPVSLGKAIQELRPNLDDKAVKSNTKLADRQAERDLEQSESAGTPDRIATRIASNNALASRLETLLPKGATLQSAAAGFKNEGQFIATLEGAKTLNLSFADLKDRVTAGQSLGQAIHALRPNLTEEASDNAAIQAEEQAKVLRAETSESAASAPSSSKH